MIVIVDYGLGNLMSIKNMLRRIGFQSTITSDLNEIRSADKLILPGVGAFDNGMQKLRDRGLEPVLNDKVLAEKTPVLGICLGMQLLGRSSEEGDLPGLGWINSKSIKFSATAQAGTTIKIPHMGWNQVAAQKRSALTRDFPDDPRFYFVHSYHMVCEDEGDILLTVDYGGKTVAAVEHGNIYGTQFHPEKSHKYGMIVLKNFAEL